jgi:hypothetical protein
MHIEHEAMSCMLQLGPIMSASSVDLQCSRQQCHNKAGVETLVADTSDKQYAAAFAAPVVTTGRGNSRGEQLVGNSWGRSLQRHSQQQCIPGSSSGSGLLRMKGHRRQKPLSLDSAALHTQRD